jgi:acyl-CoA synthetase (AMP-forming)/AMP-acid ligase II
MRLHDHLGFWARTRPEAEYAIHGARRVSYGEAASFVDRMAAAFVRRGLNSGDRIAVLSKNSIEFALLYLAASKAGVVPVPLNYRLAPPEWEYIVGDAGARILIAQSEYAEPLTRIRGSLGSVEHFALKDGEANGWDSLEAWLDVEPLSADEAHARACPDVYQMYTSGTTGRPKGVVMSQKALLAMLMQWRIAYPFFAGERMLIVAPMYHVAGALYSFHAMSHGGCAFVMSDFEPSEVARALDEDRIGFAFLVPSMIQACLTQVPDVARRRYESLRVIAYGASPIAESTLRRAMEVFGCEFIQAFGMTEVPCLTYLTSEDHHLALAGRPELLLSTGRAGPGSEIKIVDENDREVPPGTPGEICGRGAQIMSRYWNLPDASTEALRGGWMHTGDVGSVDEQGFLYIKDRIKDMIVSGAENIYPREVEDVLFSHPAVADVAVIGVPSERWGESVKAIVVLASGQQATEEELMEYCKGRIAAYKRPRSVDFIDELPRNPSGKVLKRELRERYWSGEGRRVS